MFYRANDIGEQKIEATDTSVILHACRLFAALGCYVAILPEVIVEILPLKRVKTFEGFNNYPHTISPIYQLILRSRVWVSTGTIITGHQPP